MDKYISSRVTGNGSQDSGFEERLRTLVLEERFWVSASSLSLMGFVASALVVLFAVLGAFEGALKISIALPIAAFAFINWAHCQKQLYRRRNSVDDALSKELRGTLIEV